MIDDNFNILFRRQGFRKFSYQHTTREDRYIITQRWTDSPSGGYYAPNDFYIRFGDNTFRKLLGGVYSASAGVSHLALTHICSNPAKLAAHLAYMQDQELIFETDGVVQKAPRFQHIPDIGRTLEWYVASWFEAFLQCHARYNVHVSGISEGGDLDVVAFMDGLRIWVECKSGKDITDRQLRLFARRAQEFTPVLAILLIDTDDERLVRRCIDSLDKPHPATERFQLKNERELLFWRGRGLYVVGVPHSIEESLLAVLRLYHDYVRFVPFIG